MRLIGAAILAAACAAPLAGCGQKGPLYLPPPPPAPQSRAPAKPAPESRSADRPFPDVPATDERK